MPYTFLPRKYSSRIVVTYEILATMPRTVDRSGKDGETANRRRISLRECKRANNSSQSCSSELSIGWNCWSNLLQFSKLPHKSGQRLIHGALIQGRKRGKRAYQHDPVEECCATCIFPFQTHSRIKNDSINVDFQQECDSAYDHKSDQQARCLDDVATSSLPY